MLAAKRARAVDYKAAGTFAGVRLVRRAKETLVLRLREESARGSECVTLKFIFVQSAISDELLEIDAVMLLLKQGSAR
eukprot:SAG11_NODE_18576_length_487_cov_0.659794_1_plen_78_part_00